MNAEPRCPKCNPAKPRYLSDDVREHVVTDDTHCFVLPLDTEDARDAIDALGRALWMLRDLASSTGDDDWHSGLVYAKRRFIRVFDAVYEDVGSEKYQTATGEQIFDVVDWRHREALPAMTIAVEKTDDELVVSFEEGFQATGETRTLVRDVPQDRIKEEIDACFKGITSVHAPYNPSIFERWRYGPSRVAVSIRGRADSVGLEIGIESDAPEPPLWYRLCNVLSLTNTPHARDTFDLANQTSTIQFYSNHIDR